MRRLIVQVENPLMSVEFEQSLDFCTVRMGDAIYEHLRVKKFNLRDYKDPEMLYVVKIPCAAALGQNYMAAFGKDAIYGYQHPERTELVFHELSDEDAMPKKGKRKKSKASNQLSLFEGE